MGEDGFSAAIRRDLEADGVITALIQTDASYPTPLSVVIGNPVLGSRTILTRRPPRIGGSQTRQRGRGSIPLLADVLSTRDHRPCLPTLQMLD